MGFGFDPVTKDYKIVRIAGDFLGGQESTNMHPQLSFTAEVYTMSTNYWHITGETFTARLGGSEVFPEPCPGCSPQVIMFGASFNWLTDRKIRDHARADKVGDASHTIISFDIAKEVFDFMRAPRGLMKYVRLGKCLDCLSILSHNVSSVMEIWVMRDYGVSESWTRQYHVDMNRPSIRLWGDWIPLMFGENPKEVVVGCNSGYGPFILFNHETGEERDLSDEFPENIVGQVQLIHNHIPQSLLPTYNVKTLQEKQFNECLQMLQNLNS
ncbi:F-box associated domain [Trema orientale]|uniref:F-box associated domain n=1 Tax=Trema orientale TaxID=63057 RepID=A0A2P5D1M9_TREOI|nr:F-box associated domain [Trema orientale]